MVRFASASCDVPLGGAPPPATARVVAFGWTGEDSVFDHVGLGKLRTGARFWCSGLLLARVLLRETQLGLKDRVVLEFGCGLGLTGAALAVCSEASLCILTDVEPDIVTAAASSLSYSGHAAVHHGRAELLDCVRGQEWSTHRIITPSFEQLQQRKQFGLMPSTLMVSFFRRGTA